MGANVWAELFTYGVGVRIHFEISEVMWTQL
jgi:hypothetical protein